MDVKKLGKMMNKSEESIVYRGMTSYEVAEGFDDSLTIPDLFSLLQENRERGKIIKDKLKPINDIAYGHEPIQKLDIYAQNNAENLPVFIDIHGGGWAWGSKNPRSIPAEALLNHGVIWIPIDYGLAPQYRMGDMVSHVRNAIKWVYHNISQYGGDAGRLYVTGQSSGAHLAATLLMPDWQLKLDLPEDVIKGVVLLSGIYDLDSLIYAEKNEVQDILKLNSDETRQYSPIYHLPNRTIPTIIAHGSKEPLIYAREAQDYTCALMNNGCEVSFMVVPDLNHFDMINVLADNKSELFKAAIKMMVG